MGDVVWAQVRSAAGRLVERPVGQLSAEGLEERSGVWEPPRYRGRRAITTWWRPADRAGHVGCATLGALEVAVSLEFDPKVASFASWPVRLFWAGSTDGYVPDFFARLHDGQARLVVRRPSGDAAADDGWGRTLRLVTAAGSQAGWQVRVHEGDDAVVARNRQRLARYRHERLACPGTARVLQETFAQPRRFDCGIEASGLPPLLAAACGLHLIWKGELLIDWNRPFAPGRSLAWARPEGS